MARLSLVSIGWLVAVVFGASGQNTAVTSAGPSNSSSVSQDGTSTQVSVRTIVVVPVESTSTSSSTDSATTSAPYTCDPSGPITQTGSITTTFIDAHGQVRFTGACSDYVSKVQLQKTMTTSDVWATSYPNFVLQTVNDQSCDIYGPLCQGGSITVGVDLITATTTTTVDCSYYLSAESYSNRYLLTALAFQKGIAPPYLKDFGRDAECRSWASVSSANPTALTYSNCNNASSTLGPWQDYQPMGLNNMNSPAEFYAWFSCCGTCQFYANGMRLIYFPPANLTCSRPGNSTDGVNNNATATIPPFVGSTAVYKGITMTSPSVYVEIIGTAGISDSCGPVQPIVTNPIVGVDLTDLSTLYIHPVTDGQTYYSQLRSYQSPGITKGFRPLTLSDLACPTFGLSDPEFDTVITNVIESFVNEQTRSTLTAYTSHFNYHFGPPYNPVVLPPSKLLSYHTSWLASCGTIGDGIERMLPSWGVIDPPIYLTAQKPLQPSSPQEPPTALPETTPAAPPTTMFNPSTVLPGNTSPRQPVQTDNPPSTKPGGNNGGGPGQNNPGNGGGNNDPGQSDPGSGSNNNGPGSGSGGNPGSNNGGSSNGGGNDSGSGSGSGSGGNQGPGGFIASGIGIGGGSPAPAPTTIALPAPQPGSSQTIVTIGGQPVAVPGPSTAVIAGTTLRAGDPAVTVGGSVFSIDSSGSMVVSPTAGPDTGAVPFTTIPLTSPTGSDPIYITEGGHTIAVGSGSIVAVDGVTATPGQTAITVSGTIYSIDSTGGLVVATGNTVVPGAGNSLRGGSRETSIWYSATFVVVLLVWILG